MTKTTTQFVNPLSVFSDEELEKKKKELELSAQAGSSNIYSEKSKTEGEKQTKPERQEEYLPELEQEEKGEQSKVKMEFDWSLEENVRQKEQEGLEQTARVVVGKKAPEEELPSTKIQPLSAEVKMVVELPQVKIPEPANKSLQPSDNMLARVIEQIAEKQYKQQLEIQRKTYEENLKISLKQRDEEERRQQTERKEQDEAAKNKSTERPSPSPESPKLGNSINSTNTKSQDDENTFEGIARNMEEHVKQSWTEKAQKEALKQFQNAGKEPNRGEGRC